ncbi:hypothetical protein BDV11DRAFT_190010 [Aspergillus similis]
MQVAREVSLAQESAFFSSAFSQQATNSNHNNHAAANSEKPVRACVNCVRAKARCSPGAVMIGKCERCYRMKKDCQPSPPMRRRRVVAKHSSNNRVKKLEEKLDGLLTMLKTTAQATPGTFSTSSVNSALEALVSSTQGSSAGSVTTTDGENARHTGEATLAGPLSVSPGEGSTGQQAILIHPFLAPSADEASSYLDRFRRDFIHSLPFLVVSPSMTAQQLYQDRPLLWLSIMTVASARTAQQIALSKEVRAIFGREAYVEGTRNMDFLLAVLVYTAWDRHYCVDKTISTSLVQLAIAVLYDLGLDKPPSQDSVAMITYEWKGVNKPPRRSRFANAEECRALLGCFLLSTVPMFMGRGDSLRWTPYTDECVRFLEQQNESPTDSFLIQLVKLRLIARKALDYPSPTNVAESSYLRPQATAYLRSLQAQLRDFKSNIPGELTNKYLLLELHAAQIIIYSIGFSTAPDIFSSQSNQRFECVYACLQAAKSCLETFFTLLPVEYVGFSSLVYANMMRCFIGLYRLATCVHPEWDQALLRETLNVSWILEEASKRFAQVKGAAGLDPDSSEDHTSFSMVASRLQSMKVSWDAMTSPMSSFTPASLDGLENLSSEFFSTWTW